MPAVRPVPRDPGPPPFPAPSEAVGRGVSAVLTLFGILPLLLGLGLLVAGAFLYRDARAFRARAERTPGTVQSLHYKCRRDSDGDQSCSYYPVVTFRPEANAGAVTFTSSAGSNPAQYREGQAVTVLHEPGSSRNAQIAGGFEQFGVAGILGGIGAVFAIVGASLLAGGAVVRRAAGRRRVAWR